MEKMRRDDGDDEDAEKHVRDAEIQTVRTVAHEICGSGMLTI